MKYNRVLITGGTGSFGQYMTKYLINTGNYYVRIFSRDEQKQEDMRRQFGNKNIDYVIGDVRDYQSVKDATEDYAELFILGKEKNRNTYELKEFCVIDKEVDR